MKLSELKLNERNPRQIKGAAFEKLKKSVKELPKMMRLRPIVIDTDGVILGGNMRYRALQALGYSEIPNEWVKVADDLTEEEKQRFIIEDNVQFGEWDFDMLFNEWDTPSLEDWGVEIPGELLTETSKLSEARADASMYYEPKERPQLTLRECVSIAKFNEKVQVIEDSPLTSEQKEMLKLFAYRFIRIDFESVADYYYFNADEEEKKVIERLRLVLIDGGEQGFIEDELLRITGGKKE